MLIYRLFRVFHEKAPEGGGEGGGAAETGTAGAGGSDTMAGAAGGEAAKGAASGAEQTGTGGDAAAEAAAAKAAAQWPEQGFPDDWRQRITAGLPEDMVAKLTKSKRLERAQSPQDLLRTLAAQESQIGELSGRVKVPTGKDDDPKDVAAFRKALGIPEAADKYALPKGADGKEVEGDDKAMWEQFLPDLHAAGISQRQLDAIAKVDGLRMAQAQKALQDRVSAAAEKAQEDLRVEWGKDYKANVALANRYLSEQMKGFVGEGEGDILSKRFSDGTALGEHPSFVKFIVSLAKASADDGTLLTGETTEGGNVDQRINEIVALAHKDMKKYEAAQPELQRLLAVQQKRTQRAA